MQWISSGTLSRPTCMASWTMCQSANVCAIWSHSWRLVAFGALVCSLRSVSLVVFSLLVFIFFNTANVPVCDCVSGLILYLKAHLFPAPVFSFLVGSHFILWLYCLVKFFMLWNYSCVMYLHKVSQEIKNANVCLVGSIQKATLKYNYLKNHEYSLIKAWK